MQNSTQTVSDAYDQTRDLETAALSTKRETPVVSSELLTIMTLLKVIA